MQFWNIRSGQLQSVAKFVEDRQDRRQSKIVSSRLVHRAIQKEEGRDIQQVITLQPIYYRSFEEESINRTRYGQAVSRRERTTIDLALNAAETNKYSGRAERYCVITAELFKLCNELS